MFLESTFVQGLALILDDTVQTGAVVQESARILDRQLQIRAFVRVIGKILDETGWLFIVVQDNGLFRDERVSLWAKKRGIAPRAKVRKAGRSSFRLLCCETRAFTGLLPVTPSKPGGLKPCCSGRKHQNACCKPARDPQSASRTGFSISSRLLPLCSIATQCDALLPSLSGVSISSQAGFSASSGLRSWRHQMG